MKYYIDGDFELPKHYKSSTNQFYSSTYSSSIVDYRQIAIKSDVQTTINYHSFNEIIDFYNTHEDTFKEVLRKSKIDIWFLEQFRLYFNYRNFFLKLECIHTFLSNFEDGVVISDDRNLLPFIDSQKITFVEKASAKKISKKRLLQEVFFILRHFKVFQKIKTKNLLLSVIEDNIEGQDKRFGKLNSEYDKIFNRQLFNLSMKLPKSTKKYRSSLNIDQISAQYLLSFKWLVHLFKFNKVLQDFRMNTVKSKFNSNRKSELISNLLWKNKQSYLLYYFRFKVFDRFFRKKSISGLLFINENGVQQKVIQYAAVQNNVNTYGVQHGTIHDLHPAYIFGNYNNPPILPTITFTWGTYFTELLLRKGGYTESQIKTVGRIPFPSKNKTIHPDLDSRSNIVIYATQPQRDASLREKQLRDVIEVFKELSGKYFLVIRPHPNEKNDSFFTDISKELGFHDFLIDRISDLSTHFEKSSILITSFSTVGAEYIQYYKPLVILDYLNQDLIGYIKSGVGISVKSKNELHDTLSKKTINIDKSFYKKFINEYFYESGNKSVSLITEAIANNTK